MCRNKHAQQTSEKELKGALSAKQMNEVNLARITTEDNDGKLTCIIKLQY